MQSYVMLITYVAAVHMSRGEPKGFFGKTDQRCTETKLTVFLLKNEPRKWKKAVTFYVDGGNVDNC